ncbi:MAG: beta-aspartyl-peptidase [Planctomycetes bacterium]|nr:beta-aspartyl-peptidase [Planctomycetota bacterium]
MIQVLRNAKVYAPQSLGLKDVFVAGSKIIGVVDAGCEFELPDSVEVIEHDALGRRLIPGLVDCHAHITGGGGEDGASTKVAAPLAETYFAAGVTSVVGLLGTDDITRSTEELLAGVRALREEGLSAWCWTGGYHYPLTTLTGSPREDIVHIDAVIGVGELAISDHRSSQLTLDEVLRTASDCHVGGLIARKSGVLHLHLGDGKRGLDLIRQALEQSELPARTFHPTHVNRQRALFDEALELTRLGCHIDVTAFPIEDGDGAISAADALREYLASDLPSNLISVSSDGGGCLPVFDEQGRMVKYSVGTSASLLETLNDLTGSGVALERALPAFTSNPAEHLKLEKKGRIAVGYDADLVVLDDDGSVASVFTAAETHYKNKN